MNHLKYYKECVATGYLRGGVRTRGERYRNGLCYEPFIDQNLLGLFEPTTDNCIKYHVSRTGWWAADGYMYEDSLFGPTRQNIVLLIAAMKGEL